MLVVLHHGEGLALEGDEPLLDALHVVVSAARGLAALEQPLLQHLLAHVVAEHARQRDRISSDLLPARQVVGVSREAVDEESLAAVLLDGLHDEFDGDLDRHYLALCDVALDHLALLRARLPLGTEQVTGAEVGVPKGLDDLGALSALAGAGPSEDEEADRLISPRHLAKLRRHEAGHFCRSRGDCRLEDCLVSRGRKNFDKKFDEI